MPRFSNSRPNLLLLAVGATSFAGVSFAAAPGYDFDKINQNLKNATHDTGIGSDQVKELAVQLDASGTDLDADRLEKVTIGVDLVHAPWATGQTHVSKELEVRVERNQGQTSGMIAKQFKIDLAADPLAFLKYFTRVKYESKCPVAANVTGLEKILLTEGCALSGDVQAANDLKAATNAMRTHQANMAKNLQEFVQAAQADVDAAHDQVLKEEGKRFLTRVGDLLKEIDATKITDTEGGFNITHGTLRFGKREIQNLQINASPKQTTISYLFKAPINLKIYEAMKPEIPHMLDGLQKGEDFAVEHVRGELRVFNRLLNDFAVGQLGPIFLGPIFEGRQAMRGEVMDYMLVADAE